MLRSMKGRGLALLVSASLLACGGGGGSPSDTTATPSTQEPPLVVTPSGTLQVASFDAATGASLGQVTVTLSGKTVISDSKGEAAFTTVQGIGLTVQGSKAGYADAFVRLDVPNGKTSAVKLLLTPVAHTGTLGVADGGAVTLAGSMAQVTLPANALVYDGSKVKATGRVTVSISPIDPAAQASAMPGSYLASVDGGTQPIESFGAIQVQLTDAAGKRLQLAEGQTASIRIPLKTRSTVSPATVPLYYLNETTGLWQQEGTATLNQDFATGAYYYEGTVGHFSTWNADKPITETVYVSGCVRDADGKSIPSDSIFIYTEGLDYSGLGSVIMAADGSFKVPLKRNAQAKLTAYSANGNSRPVALNALSSDTILGTCLVLGAPTVLPVILYSTPSPASVVVGQDTSFFVAAHGVGVPRFQWQRNGVNLPGETGPTLVLHHVALTDDGAVYRAVVSNNAGSVNSDGITIKVTSDTTAVQIQNFFALLQTVSEATNLALAPGNAADMENARMLAPGAVCVVGSVNTLSLNGKAAQGGELLNPDTPYALTVGFVNCVINDDRPWGDLPLFNGRADASFTYHRLANNAGFSLNTSTQLTKLDNQRSNMRGDGRFDASIGTQGFSLTPINGAKLTNLNTGRVLTYSGGSYQADTAGNQTFQGLTFVLNGTQYVFNGTIQVNVNNGNTALSSTLTLTGKGEPLAKLTVVNGVLTPVITGVIDSF